MDCFVLAGDLGGQVVDSSKIKNYMGFAVITGAELTAKFKEQPIGSNYVDHLLTEAEQIDTLIERSKGLNGVK